MATHSAAASCGRTVYNGFVYNGGTVYNEEHLPPQEWEEVHGRE